MAGVKSDIIAALQKEILSLNGIKAPEIVNAPQRGLDFLKDHLPNRSFPVNGIHEFICSHPTEIAPTCGFINALLSSYIGVKGMMIWICRDTFIFPPSIIEFDIDFFPGGCPSPDIYFHISLQYHAVSHKAGQSYLLINLNLIKRCTYDQKRDYFLVHDYFNWVLLTNAIRLLSGDQDGVPVREPK